MGTSSSTNSLSLSRFIGKNDSVEGDRYHQCYSIGDNSCGQQGNNIVDIPTKQLCLIELPFNIKIRSITSGLRSVYILSENDTLYVCGNNAHGQLSILNETTKDILLFWGESDFIGDDILDLLVRYIGEIQCGKARQTSFIHTWCHKDILFLSSGIAASHIFKYTQDHRLYAAGNNEHNQLCIWSDNIRMRKFTEIKYFKINKIKLKKIQCACDYSLFLAENGNIYSCGTSLCGGLGLGENRTSVHQINCVTPTHSVSMIDIACGEQHSLALDAQQNVFSFGSNAFGQLGLRMNENMNVYKPTLIRYLAKKKIEIIKVKCGALHSVILDIKGRVYCFGCNASYECGNDEVDNVNKPQLNHTLQKKDIIVMDVHCGFDHNVVQTVDNHYYLWGDNQFKQCLVFNKNALFVTKPTRYKAKHIIALYVGYKATRIVTNN